MVQILAQGLEVVFKMTQSKKHRRSVFLVSLLLLAVGTGAIQAEISPEGQVNVKALRQAIHRLMETCGDQYPQGKTFLNQLANLEKIWQNTPQQSQQLARLQRQALIAHPSLVRRPILFVAFRMAFHQRR